jgi:hypothetical protein
MAVGFSSPGSRRLTWMMTGAVVLFAAPSTADPPRAETPPGLLAPLPGPMPGWREAAGAMPGSESAGDPSRAVQAAVDETIRDLTQAMQAVGPTVFLGEPLRTGAPGLIEALAREAVDHDASGDVWQPVEAPRPADGGSYVEGMFFAGPGSATPYIEGMPARGDRVRTLRRTASQLGAMADELEEAELYEEADELRATAQSLRERARSTASGTRMPPGPVSDGGPTYGPPTDGPRTYGPPTIGPQSLGPETPGAPPTGPGPATYGPPMEERPAPTGPESTRSL